MVTPFDVNVIWQLTPEVVLQTDANGALTGTLWALTKFPVGACSVTGALPSVELLSLVGWLPVSVLVGLGEDVGAGLGFCFELSVSVGSPLVLWLAVPYVAWSLLALWKTWVMPLTSSTANTRASKSTIPTISSIVRLGFFDFVKYIIFIIIGFSV